MDVVDTLKTLVSFRSITPKDDGIMEFVKSFLKDFTVLEIEKEGVKNVFLYKRFGEGVHLCFAGHIDVVPPGEGWSCDPFEAYESEGYIYGRGTQDMKSGVAAMMHALKDANFEGTLSLLLTSDEEGDAIWGTRYVLEVLKSKNLLPDFAVVGEPTATSECGDTIKIGRRGSINGELEIFGVQGHVAYYEKCVNPVEIVGDKLGRLAGHKLDEGSEFFEPSRIVVTNLHAGIGATNVTPSSLKIGFNVRNSVKTVEDDVQNYIEEVFEGKKYALRTTVGSKPFLSDSSSIVVKKCIEAIEDSCGFVPNLSTSGGTSDARFFALQKIPVVEVGVVNDRIHAVDERVLAKEVIKLEEIYKKIITLFTIG